MARFDSIQWSVVLRAGGDGADSRRALEALCRTYRPPVLGYVQSRGYASDTAEDLTQAFFVDFIERAAHALGLRRNTVAVAVHRLRHRLRELVRAELVQTTAAAPDSKPNCATCVRRWRVSLAETEP